MKVGGILDRLALVAKLAVFVLGTKDKTVLNHVSRGLDKAKVVKDMFGSPDETLKRGDDGVVIIELLIICIILAPVAIALLS